MASITLKVTIESLSNDELDNIEKQFTNFLRQENAQLQSLVPGVVDVDNIEEHDREEDDEEDED
jgi:hypothetical protein